MKIFGIPPKILAAFVLVALFVTELKQGYFSGFKTYLRNILWKTYLPFIVIPALLILPLLWIDPLIIRWVLNENSSLAQAIANVGGQMGRGTNCWTFLACLYMAAYILKQDAIRKVIFGMLLSSFVTALIITLIKFTFLRARPYAELGSFSFFNFHGLLQDAREFQSFPSGDVGVVAGAAAYLFFRARFRMMSLSIFLLPLMTAFARMNANKHWPSDTLMAIAVGLIGAKFIYDFKKESFCKTPS